MPRQPYGGSSKTRTIEGGTGVVRTQDLHAHQDGTLRRHGADTIDMNPVLSGAFSQTTVQSLLETISDFITDAGQGFIAIGNTPPDGYDAGDFNVTDSFPLEEAIEAAQASTRLQQGGVILIKSGTYRLNRKVTLNQGICIMGEPSGTIIVSATNQEAMFVIPTSPTPPDLGNWLGVTPNTASTGVRYNRFYNIILADNLDGYKGSSPTIPNTITAGNLGLIQCNRGSYLICEKVTFLGKVSTSLNPEVMTRRAIDYIGNSANPTILTMEACYFDAMENCVTFTPTNGKNFLSIKGCRMRHLGQNTVTPDVDRSCAISFNISNVNIEGNYFLGDTSAKYAVQLRNFTLADSQLLEGSSATDSLIPRIVLMGNSGGLNAGSATERAQNFFINSSSNSAFRMVNAGNTWGSNPVNPWGVVIGDGSTSIGDINGVKALDVAVLASQNSRSESTIYINPGSYTYTTAGSTSSFPKLVGNIRGTGQRPVISLSSSSTDSLSRKQVYVGSEIRNIKFTSVSTFHVVTLNTGTSNVIRNLTVDNCEFLDAGLQTETFANSSIQSLETRVSVLNTRFSQSGSFTDNLSCYLVGEIDHVLIENTSFIGHGYALRVQDSSFTYNQKVTLNNVYFDSAGDGATNMISVAAPSTQNYYILILCIFGTVTFNNVKLDAVINAPTATYPVVSTMRDDGSFRRYTNIACKNFIADSCVLLFPQQKYTVSATNYGMIGLFVEPTSTFMMSNSQICGSIPLRIGGGSSFTDNEGSVGEGAGAYCSVKNCIISGYPDATGTIVNSTMLDIDMPEYTGNRDSGKPQIIIDGCKIDNYVMGSDYYAPQHTANNVFYGGGGVIIIAKGWSVNFTNNLVHILQTDTSNNGTSMSAVFIDTINDDSGSNGALKNASVHISNNDITLNSAGTYGTSSNIYSCLCFRTAYGNVTNNYINYRSRTAAESTPYRVYIKADISENDSDATNHGACVISNNTFERYQALSKALIYFDGGLGKNCIFSDNIFISELVVAASTSPQFIDNTNTSWTKVKNKNQSGVIKLNATQGSILILNNFISSAHNENQFNVGTFQTNIFPSASSGSKGITVNQSLNGSNLSFTWAVSLLQVLPFGARISNIKMTVVVSSGWTSGSFRIQAGGNTTTVVNNTVSATGAGGFVNLTFAGSSTTNTLNVSLENNPYIVIDCNPLLSANNTNLHTGDIDVELTYLQ